MAEPWKRKEVIGDCTLYLGDCLEIKAILPRNCRVVSDPPYGMDWNTDSTRFSGGNSERSGRAQQQARGKPAGRDNWGDIEGDKAPFDPAPWLDFKSAVLWGAHHYFQRLPVGRVLLWLKKPADLLGTFLSDFEVGWASGGHGCFAHYRQFPPPSRIVENDGRNVGHPTQKPISLMEWCIQEFARGDEPILDPYMGSGTTGVACIRLGRSFIGVEKDAAHFETACKRIRAAYAQPDMFVSTPAPQPEQLSILDEAS